MPRHLDPYLRAWQDINPNNLVYNPETGQLLIIDFGISILLRSFSTEHTSTRTHEALSDSASVHRVFSVLFPAAASRPWC